MSRYRLELIHNIADITPAQWNHVTGDTLQRGYRWQQYKQLAQDKKRPSAWTAFITVWRGNDLAGIATAYRYAIPFGFKSARAREASRWFLAPANPLNFLVPPTVAADAAATDVLPLLLKGVRQLALRRLVPGIRMVFLEEAHHQPLLAQLQQANYWVGEGIWENELHVPWSDFDGYVRSLRSTPRKQLRKQREKTAVAGITITTAPPSSIEPTYALLARVAAHNRSRLLYNCDFWHHAQTVLGEGRVTLFRALHEGREVACLMMYHDDTTAQLAAIGLDYDYSLRYNLYRILIYAAIERCIERNITLIKGGMSRYDIKRRLGFLSKPTLTATNAWMPILKQYYGFTPKGLQDR